MAAYASAMLAANGRFSYLLGSWRHFLILRHSQVQVPVPTEVQYGRRKTPTSYDFTERPFFIWYDYFSCPQGSDSTSVHSRQCAIDTIVAYVSRCEYFVILCPVVTHRDQQRVLGEDAWAERTWCRWGLASIQGSLCSVFLLKCR